MVFGTRPEAIKLCPVVRALRDRSELSVHVCATGQHRSMLDQVLRVFGVEPDTDLELMQPGQTLAILSARLLTALDEWLERLGPELVVVQGDTTTALCASLAAFYRNVPVAHVEAGLRTGDLASPFPEEMNRVVVGRIASLHFAPTRGASEHLLREGVPSDRIWVTGNTVIDALQYAVDAVRRQEPRIRGLEGMSLRDGRRIVLVTGHRRESFGAGFEAICRAIRRAAERFPDVLVIYPVHLNPNVREPVFRLLGGLPNVKLIDPVDYLEFVHLMDRATLVLTDSGGVQEEAPSLHKPVLVMRDTTERPEAISAGVAKLVTTDTERILQAVTELLSDTEAFGAMVRGASPFGDGHASRRIAATCAAHLSTKGDRRSSAGESVG